MAPGVFLTSPATPPLPLAVIPVGQVTVVPSPTWLLKSGLIVLRCLAKTKVVPLPSERPTNGDRCVREFYPFVPFRDCRIIPFRNFAEEDPAVRLAGKLQGFYARQIVSQHDAARRDWNQYHSLFHFRDLLIGHRGVTCREINNSLRKIAGASTTTHREVHNPQI